MNLKFVASSVLASLMLFASAHAQESWVQIAKTGSATYDMDLAATSVDPTLRAVIIKLRILPNAPYVRSDKIKVYKFFEYGVVLCDQKRYILTGQDHFDKDNKFIDANNGVQIYRATGKPHDLVTHIISVSCGIPILGTSKPGEDV